MFRDMAPSEDVSPKHAKKPLQPKSLSSKTSEDTTDLEGRSLEAHPKPKMRPSLLLKHTQKRPEPENPILNQVKE